VTNRLQPVAAVGLVDVPLAGVALAGGRKNQTERYNSR
jgi:hypothetical protein